MNTDRLLKELAKRDIVSSKVLKSLEARLADKSDVPSPRSVAKFLVDKGHLTVPQAKKVLKAILTPEESAILDSETVEDDLPDLPSLSNIGFSAATETSGPDLDAAIGEPRSGSKKDKKSKKKDKKKSKRQNEFDSPLILLGTGGLILMVLVGAAIVYLLGSESADQQLKNAKESYDQGSYNNAIAGYKQFLESHSSHEKASLARVTLGTAEIRMRTDVSNNWDDALKEAKEQCDIIEDEEEYKLAQPELATLLPKIADELSQKADAATEIEQMQKYVGMTKEALALCGNAKFIPSSMRDKGNIKKIRDVLDRIASRQKALENLRDTLAAMNAAAASGKPAEAYDAHAAFVKANPELAQDERMKEAVANAAKAEQGLIKFTPESRAALTAEPESPVVAALAVATPRVKAEAPASGVGVFRLAGGLYGVSAKDGQLLWRRSVGASQDALSPVFIENDLLTFDVKRKELVRLGAEKGNLVWRVALDDVIARPVISGDRVLCSGRSGKLFVVNAGTGEVSGHVQFAQPLRSSPAVGTEGKSLFVVGEHSTLYSLSAADLSCTGVFYLGHAKGAIEAPPIALANRVVLFENDGASTSTIHVLGINDQGVAERQLHSRRVSGLVNQAPDVFGRRFALVTDTGHADVFEAAPEDDSQPIVMIATRKSPRPRRGVRYALVVKGNLWMADVGIANYAISPSGNRLTARKMAQQFRRDSFVHPLLAMDDVVIHARKRKGKPGVTIAASSRKDGKVFWETDLASPPAGAPVSQAGSTSLLHATADGSVFQVSKLAQRYGVLNAPLPVGDDREIPILEAAGVESDGGAVHWAIEQGRATATEANGKRLATYDIPGQLACEPVRLGEGWITPLSLGQVYYLRARDGSPLAAPFQPVLRPGQQVAWKQPAVAGNRIAIADGRAVYALEFVDEAPSSLEEIARIDAAGADAVRTRIAATGDLAFCGRKNNRLTALSLGSLEEVGAVELDSPIIWGPFAIGGRVIAATSGGGFVCVDSQAPGQLAWETKSVTRDLVGRPLASGDSVTVARRSGGIIKLDLQTGKTLNAIDVGQRLATGPTPHGDDLAFSTADGAVLIVQQP